MRLKTIAMMLTLGIAAGGEAPAQQAAPLNPTNFGLVSPQPQSELPHSATPPQQAVRKPKRPAQARLVPSGADSWVLSDGWELAQTDRLVGSDGSLFDSAYDTSAWYNAVVPGTVLTSLVEAGVYPDPYYGLNNLSIPDSLCRTEWWYRIRFPQPRDVAGHRVWLRFDGINYRADVWLNGRKAGTVDGAFTRGVFDVTGFFSAENVLAVKIRPPHNPGIPHEQSKAAGRGPNGGQLCLDGPTFISSEGWDWIPGIRDRNIGIWQDVTLEFTGDVTLADPQVITDLPLPDTSYADLTIRAKSVMAMCYSMNGRFLEADRVLAGATDTLHMSRATQAAYYAAQHRQNRECRSQSEPGAERDRFRACEEYYARRALETTGDISKRFYFAYLVAVDEGDYDRAAAACDSALACAPPASHDYARAAFYRSETERFRGDEAARFEWLVHAAMADVQGAVRDYGALGGVAEELLRRGDAARAMRCIRVAINDTQAYNSPIRSWRDMAILPQIEQAYSERNARLRAMYVALILLAFLFALSAIGGVLFVLRQNRRLNAVQQTLRESNGKLAELAASLRETNADLSRQNIRIADANRIKEVYIGGFLKTISEYIYKLADTYRHVGRMLRDGRSDELRREYAGTDVRSDELKEFYHNFDTTFLGLFPSFIGEFNRLLADDARIGVRRPGSLTTELRIFALVRLGITDTATIAALLHCSVNTVYSYRSRMRLRSLVPERDFEQRVQSIGLWDDAAELSGT